MKDEAYFIRDKETNELIYGPYFSLKTARAKITRRLVASRYATDAELAQRVQAAIDRYEMVLMKYTPIAAFAYPGPVVKGK